MLRSLGKILRMPGCQLQPSTAIPVAIPKNCACACVNFQSLRFKQDFVPPHDWDLSDERKRYGTTIEKWKYYNEIVWPPNFQEKNSKEVEIFHSRENIKYSPKKMWIICHLIRGRSIEDAIKFLTFIPRKGSIIAKEVLEEAQQMAIRDHNVEFKSNLWIAEAYSSQSFSVKGVRKHGRGRHGLVVYRYCNLFIRLVEGKPPEDLQKFQKIPRKYGWELMEDYLQWLRDRRIIGGL